MHIFSSHKSKTVDGIRLRHHLTALLSVTLTIQILLYAWNGEVNQVALASNCLFLLLVD